MKEIIILKKDRPSHNNSVTEINMQANEQTNFDRQNGKKDDLEHRSNITVNNW